MDYRLWFDGVSRGNPGSAGAGCLIEGAHFSKELKLPLGKQTNNYAEYRAVLLGLGYIKKNFQMFSDMQHLTVRGDSQLVIKQLQGKWKVKSKNIQELYLESRNLIKYLRDKNIKLKLEYIPRKDNHIADRLANEGADLN